MLKRTVREQYPTRPILFPVCKQLQRPPFKGESSVICCRAVTFDSSKSVCSLCLLPFFNYASRTRLIAIVTYTESSEEGTGIKPRNLHPQCEGRHRAEDLCALERWGEMGVCARARASLCARASVSAGTSAAPSLVRFFVRSTVRVKARLLIAFPVPRPLSPFILHTSKQSKCKYNAEKPFHSL